MLSSVSGAALAARRGRDVIQARRRQAEQDALNQVLEPRHRAKLALRYCEARAQHDRHQRRPLARQSEALGEIHEGENRRDRHQG